MQINFTGNGVDVTDQLRTFTGEKLERLKNHFDHIISINVIFRKVRAQHIVDASVAVNRGELHASADASDMYSAVDLLIDKLDRQIVKHKEKLQDHRD